MIVTEHEQGSKQWLKAREGVFSASRLKPLMSKGGKQSRAEGAKTLIVEIIGEIITGGPLDEASGDWLERGQDMEREARNFLEMKLNADVEEVGFCIMDDGGPLHGRVGASPDGMANTDKLRLVEFKCPSAKMHLKYLLNPKLLEQAYAHQTHTGMMVTGTTECHLVSYCPGLPTVHTVVVLDEDYLTQLKSVLGWAIEQVDDGVAKIKELLAVDVDPLNPFS